MNQDTTTTALQVECMLDIPGRSRSSIAVLCVQTRQSGAQGGHLREAAPTDILSSSCQI